MEQKVELSVEGMTCIDCAQTITRYLEKKGSKSVKVNYTTGKAKFEVDDQKSLPELLKGIQGLGYHAISAEDDPGHHGHDHSHSDSGVEKKFIFCLVFTIPLFFHMFLPFGFLHDPVVQLLLCLPVMITGMMHFGKSAWGSLKIDRKSVV